MQDSLISSFLKLENLHLVHCHFEVGPGGGGDLQFNLPSLRHLVYSHSPEALPQDQIVFLTSIVSTLASIVYSSDNWTLLPSSVTENSSIRILYDTELPETTKYAASIEIVRHLRIWSFCLDHRSRTEDATVDVGQLEIWTDLIRKSKSLRVLYLPLAPTGVEIHEVLRDPLTKLLRVCRDRGIKVVREERTAGVDFWHSASQEFIQMAEEH